MHLLILRDEPFAVFKSGSPIEEQGRPTMGLMSLLHNVTPDPVSNRALTLTPPKEMSAFGRENSGRAALKQFRAVRQVSNLWGMSRLRAIPLDRFPTTTDFLDIGQVLPHGNTYPLSMGRGHKRHISLYHDRG